MSLGHNSCPPLSGCAVQVWKPVVAIPLLVPSPPVVPESCAAWDNHRLRKLETCNRSISSRRSSQGWTATRYWIGGVDGMISDHRFTRNLDWSSWTQVGSRLGSPKLLPN